MWLGDGGIDSDRAMNLLQESYEFLLSLEGGPTSYPSPTASLTQNDKMTKWWDEVTDLEVVRRLLEREYWSRVWIVQEVVLAAQVIICCGSKSIPWNALICNSREFCYLPIAFQVDVFARSIPARLNDQRISRQLSSCNLLEILQQCQACRFHDPRDKIFGFLGISDDCKGQLQADYSKSAYEVCKEVAEFLIRTSRDIDTSNDLEMRAELSHFAHRFLRSPIPPISQSLPWA